MSFKVIKSGTSQKLVYDMISSLYSVVTFTHQVDVKQSNALKLLKYRQDHEQSL